MPGPHIYTDATRKVLQRENEMTSPEPSLEDAIGTELSSLWLCARERGHHVALHLAAETIVKLRRELAKARDPR